MAVQAYITFTKGTSSEMAHRNEREGRMSQLYCSVLAGVQIIRTAVSEVERDAAGDRA